MRRHRVQTAFAAAAAALSLLALHSAGTTARAQAAVGISEIVHFAETRGRITNTPNSFDTTIYAHYVGTSKLTLDITLFDERTGLPLPGACAAPRTCTFVFGGGAPARQTIHFEDLVDFSRGNVVLGTAQLRVSGADDPAKLLMDVYLVNAHSGAFDLSFTLLPLHPVIPFSR